MAWQHLYSRVPARVSMYNRADGFDTFAQSAGLEQEFVEREMAPIYENKLNKNDVTRIRRGEMPCVYTQCCTRSGVLVQNCVSYLPLDYTGERSAYLSHSLIYSSEEKKEILFSGSGAILNPGLFVRDISGFDLTSAGAVPDPDYPQLSYVPGQPEETAILIRDVDPETAKSFLYAILYAICGKGRNVYFKLHGQDEQLSLRSVKLYNEILSILPFQLRAPLSFASYVTDASLYSSFKLKGVSSSFPEAAASKFVYFDLQTNLITGVHHDEVVANKSLIGFFYSLLDNLPLRQEFLSFMERAADVIPSLQTLNLKVLSNLVFLFQCSSSLFVEADILPNDSLVFDYFCAYEKYRLTLIDEYRMQPYRVLLRYPRNHLVIPKNIFAKASRLYPSETPSAKRIFMNIVLDLIHTDIMRDKLFSFIRANYPTEDPDVKHTIIDNLSRVFYGGFLQNQILAFFSERFQEEPESSRSLIIHKLLLSIRTPAVQAKILAFFDQHYDSLNQSQKDSFYETFLEMLPERDALADALVKAVNNHIDKESEERKESLTRRLTDILEADYRRKDHALMPILVTHQGFCRDLVARLAFGPWQTRRLRGEYMQLLQSKPLTEKTAALIDAFALVPELDQNLLLAEMDYLYDPNGEKGDLYQWLETAQQLGSLPEDFTKKVHASVVEPAVCRTAWDAFDVRWRSDGMVLLEAYAKDHPAVAESNGYRVITLYNRMISAAQNLDYAAVVSILESLLEYSELLPRMADHMAHCAIHPEKQTPEAVLCLEVLQSVLRDQTVPLGKLYRKCASGASPEQAMTLMLSVCVPLSEAGPVMLEAMTASGSGAEDMMAAFSAGFGRGVHGWLRSHLPHGSELAAHLEKAYQSQKAKGGTFLSKLFGKKK